MSDTWFYFYVTERVKDIRVDLTEGLLRGLNAKSRQDEESFSATFQCCPED